MIRYKIIVGQNFFSESLKDDLIDLEVFFNV